MSRAGFFFTAAWIAQFVGHGKFEGRAPALLDSLFQSLVLAVFFVFMEILFEMGYKPELHKRLQNVSLLYLLSRRKSLMYSDSFPSESYVPTAHWQGDCGVQTG